MSGYKFDGKYLQSGSDKIGEVRGNDIWSGSNKIGEIRGNDIWRGSSKIGDVRGQDIWMGSNKVGTMNDARKAIDGPGGVTLAALWLLLVK